MAERRLLKVLFIHGYRQSAKSSYEKTGSFRKGLKKFIEAVYITAPHKVPVEDGEIEDEKDIKDEYGWWFSSQGPVSFNALEESESELGHEESLTFVKETLATQGPFDGIIGFSQGATLVAHLCALRESDEKTYNFRFAILCAGFKSKSSCHQKYYGSKITCPTLHIFGDTDKVIPKECSVELAELFKSPVIVEHTGGHYLPNGALEKKAYQNFLQGFMS